MSRLGIAPDGAAAGASSMARGGAAPLFADLAGDIALSFEFFPPADADMAARLWGAIQALAPLAPRFVSVTYGAGGSTRAHTHATVQRILDETALTPAAHLTCVGAPRGEIDDIARAYWDMGVRHIVALRGDPPAGARFAPHPQGYADAAELVAGLKRVADFEISVAAYPECHPEARCPEADVDHLARKIDAGATRAITQFFFSPDCFLGFRDRVARRLPGTELVPGILPVSNVAQTRRFAALCGATIPCWMDRLFDGLDDRPDTRRLVAATLAAELVRALYGEGVRDFHFFTLNRAALTSAICHLLGVRPRALTTGQAA